MTGKIYCSRCGTDFSKQTAGVCPKCGNPKCFISLFWKRPGEEQARRYKFYQDVLRGNVPLYYETAKDQLIAMNRDIRAGGKFDPTAWSPAFVAANRIAALAEDWLVEKDKEVAKKELKPGTLHSYRSHMKAHIIPRLGSTDIAVLASDTELLKSFKNTMPVHLKKKTQREIMHTLHNFLTWCVLERRAATAVPLLPRIKGRDSEPKQALSAEQKIEALRKLPERHRDFYEFEMRTGVRPGEACAIKVQDVLLNLQAIRIQRTFSARVLVESDKEDHKMLLALTQRTLEIVTKHAEGKGPEDFLFTNPDAANRPYSVHRTELYWKRWSGTSVTHYEATRHSAATKMAELFDIRAAQRLLRQADLRSTQKYVHEAVDHLREQMEQYDQTMPADSLRTQESEAKEQELQEVDGGRAWGSNIITWLILLAFLPPSDTPRTE